MTDLSNIWRFDLIKGNSSDPHMGACLLDAVSWFEYGRLGDRPPCVAKTLAEPGRVINDHLPDDRRQELKALIPLMIGTAGDGFNQARGEYWAWQAIRVFAPLALKCAGLEDHATILRQFSGSLAETAAAAEAMVHNLRGCTVFVEAAAALWAGAALWAAARRSAGAAARYAAEAARYAAEAAGYAAWAAASLPTIRTKVDDAMIAAMRGACEIGRPRELTAEQIEHANRSFELARV